MSWAKRTDANQQDILNALHQAGMSAIFIGQPVDILASYAGKNYLFEVKTEKGKLNKKQREFFDTWRGQVTVVRNAQQALDYIMDDMED